MENLTFASVEDCGVEVGLDLVSVPDMADSALTLNASDFTVGDETQRYVRGVSVYVCPCGSSESRNWIVSSGAHVASNRFDRTQHESINNVCQNVLFGCKVMVERRQGYVCAKCNRADGGAVVAVFVKCADSSGDDTVSPLGRGGPPGGSWGITRTSVRHVPESIGAQSSSQGRATPSEVCDRP